VVVVVVDGTLSTFVSEIEHISVPVPPILLSLSRALNNYIHRYTSSRGLEIDFHRLRITSSMPTTNNEEEDDWETVNLPHHSRNKKLMKGGYRDPNQSKRKAKANSTDIPT